MILTKEQRQELIKLGTPLCEWLQKNCHPHIYIEIESDRIEVIEGIACVAAVEINREELNGEHDVVIDAINQESLHQE